MPEIWYVKSSHMNSLSFGLTRALSLWGAKNRWILAGDVTIHHITNATYVMCSDAIIIVRYLVGFDYLPAKEFGFCENPIN